MQGRSWARYRLVSIRDIGLPLRVYSQPLASRRVLQTEGLYVCRGSLGAGRSDGARRVSVVVVVVAERRGRWWSGKRRVESSVIGVSLP